jgi:rhodanese-related sulfurtransferase
VIIRIDALEAESLLQAGTVVIDVLPESVYRDEHLPGAVSMPLETFTPDQVERYDRGDNLIVYCFDQHCDLSARAATRLDHLGFEQVHDLIGGRAAWTALGLPTEGAVGDRRRIGHHVAPVSSVGLDATIADVAALRPARFPIPVLDENGVLLGAVDPTATALPSDTKVTDVMIPAPGTIRPELRVDEVVEQLRKDGLDHVFVTAVSGRLIGEVVTDELRV